MDGCVAGGGQLVQTRAGNGREGDPRGRNTKKKKRNKRIALNMQLIYGMVRKLDDFGNKLRAFGCFSHLQKERQLETPKNLNTAGETSGEI